MSQRSVHCEQLPNGLTVVLHETDTAPVAEFQIWARAGSADERDDERGLAHFLEHMLFKGTARRGLGEIAGEVEGAGGRINAYTSHDVTVYHATTPSDAFETGVDVLCDAVLHSTFDPDEIAREIEVVLEEIRRSDDSPGSVLSNAVFDTAFAEHPYRHPILGTRESVAGFDRARVRRFYDRWYAPDNLVAIAVGCFDRAKVLDAIRSAFADRAPSGARRARRAEPPQRELRAAILSRPFERASVEIAYPGVALSHPEEEFAEMLVKAAALLRAIGRAAGRDDAWWEPPLRR